MAEGLVGVVLAAGAGTRLRPLTERIPKALAEVGDRPLLDWALARIGPCVARTAVNVHHHADLMLAALADRDVHVSLETPDALGTAGALGQLREWIDGAPVLVTNADAWYGRPDPLPDLVGGWDGERPRLLVAPALRGDPDGSGRRGGEFDGLRYVGTALLPWWSVRELAPVPSGLYEVSWQQLFEAGRLDLVETPVEAIDVGTPAALERADLAAAALPGEPGTRAATRAGGE